MDKEQVKIDFCRICELTVGQRFRYNGFWREVLKIVDGRIYYKDISDYIANYSGDSLGANSRQFVEIVKPFKPSA